MEKKEWKKKIPMWIKEGLFEEVTDDRGTRILGYVNCSDKVLDFIEQEIDRAREEGRKERTDELKQAFHEVFYKSGELWFNYIFEDGDTKAEQEAKGVVEDYWDEIISKLKTKEDGKRK